MPASVDHHELRTRDRFGKPLAHRQVNPQVIAPPDDERGRANGSHVVIQDREPQGILPEGATGQQVLEVIVV